MSEIIESDKETKKIWSTGQIYLGTFLTGPFTGCLLLSQNFKAFGEKVAAKKSFWAGIFMTLFLMLLLSILPDQIFDKIPKHIIPALYLGPIVVFTNVRQKKGIEAHFNQKGKKQSHLKLIGVMLFSLLSIFTVAFIIGAISIDF